MPVTELLDLSLQLGDLVFEIANVCPWVGVLGAWVSVLADGA